MNTPRKVSVEIDEETLAEMHLKLGSSHYTIGFDFPEDRAREHRVYRTLDIWRHGSTPDEMRFAHRVNGDTVEEVSLRVRDLFSWLPALVARSFGGGSVVDDVPTIQRDYHLGRQVRAALAGGERVILYRIEAGDTLSAIAKRFLGDAGKWAEIYCMNLHTLKSGDADVIHPGEIIAIPLEDDLRLPSRTA